MNGVTPTTTIAGVMAGGGGWGASAGISLIGGFGPRCTFTPGSFTTGTGGGSGSAGGNGLGLPATAPSLIYPGAAGGRAINLNANTVTWGATGTIYGAVA
jgi:hypothetical protein